MFKLLAIRPLEGCPPHIQKCLKTEMMYYLCNDYIIEPNSHIRRRSKNIKPLKEDFFTVISEYDDIIDDSSKENSPTVSVSAIVGKNGDGKSTLVELMIRLINNCAIAYNMYASANNLRRVKGVKTELYYLVDNVVYRMAEENNQNETRIWKVAELKTGFDNKDNEVMRWDIKPKLIKNVDENHKCFFFTIVSNYSHYAYNVYDYEREWEIRGNEKDDDEKCWLHYIFHKNDGYLTPITLHPLRYKGNIDINNETWLSKQRMLSLFLNADNPTKKEHSFRRVNGKDANVLKLTEEKESKLQQKAIIDFFKTVGDENGFYDLLQKMQEIDESINENEHQFMVLQKKNEDWMVKYNDLVDNVLPLNFINPIKQIVEQDVDFVIFVSEVVAWLNTIGDSILHNSGDISLVLEQYYNLHEKKVRYAQTQLDNNAGMEYENEGEKNTAMRAYEESIRLNPKDAKVYINRGNAYCKMGDYNAAIRDYGKAIRLDPKGAEAYFNRGNANCGIGDYNAAIWDYGKAIALNSKDVDVYINRGNIYCNIGDYDAAIGDYKKAIALNPRNADAYINRGNIYYKKGDYNAAIRDYGKAIRLDPKNAEAPFNRGNIYCEIGNYDAAIRDYEKAIALNPSNADAYFNQGNVYYQTGDYAAAIRDYEKAIALNPSNADAYFNQGNAYYQTGDYDAALYEYDIVINMKPKFEEAYHNRGNAYYNKGEYNKAIGDYSREIELYPMNAEAYYNRGNAYFNMMEYDKAINDYNKAIKFPVNKGKYVMNNGSDDEWLEGLNLKDANAYNNRGNANYKIGDYDAAIWDYSKAINLNPSGIKAYINRGNVRCKIGDYGAAIWDYGAAINLNPKNAEAYIYQANAYYQKDDYDAAIYEYNIATKLNPSYSSKGGGDIDSMIDYMNNDSCKQADNAVAIQILKTNNNQKGNDSQLMLWQFHWDSEKKIHVLMESIKELEFVDVINVAQLSRLDTLYRIMKSYGVDWKVVTKNYFDLSLEEKCEHYIIYKVWSILSTYPQYKKAYQKDNIKSIRECGVELEKCIEEIINDEYSHITRKLRQVKHFMDEKLQDGGLYERLGKKIKDTGTLFVEIDELKKYYGGKSLSLDNLPPPIYKWDIMFNRKEDPVHCNIELDSFSSGEKQKLNSIGAIIYHLQNLAHTASKVKYNNVNLVLEEIELYYHPEYQRQYFNELLARIKGAKLENIQNINFVFVTHSPFILSDIPKCNVLFLKDGMPCDELQENTFGANIHGLLKHGFFMPNLPIGEFAYGKINALFKKLNSGELNPAEDLDDIYQEILLVGEPFLRNQLLLLYNSYKGRTSMSINPIKKETLL